MVGDKKRRAGIGDPRTLFRPYLPGSVVGEISMPTQSPGCKITRVQGVIVLMDEQDLPFSNLLGTHAACSQTEGAKRHPAVSASTRAPIMQCGFALPLF